MTAKIDINKTAAARLRHNKRRMVKDVLARYAVTVGGASVILAIALIFFYLFFVVVPLFKSAEIDPVASYSVESAGSSETLYLAMEEQSEIGVRFTRSAVAEFYNLDDGSLRYREEIELPAGAAVSSFASAALEHGLVVYGLSNGQAVVVKHQYKVTFPNDQRKITPQIAYPFGEEPITIDDEGDILSYIAFQNGEEEATIAAATNDGRLLMTHLIKEESMMDEGMFDIEQENLTLNYDSSTLDYLLMGQEQDKIYAIDQSGELSFFNIRDKEEPELEQRLRIVEQGARVTTAMFLTGGISLMVGDSTGRISQWFPVRDEHNNKVLTLIRSFDAQDKPIDKIAIESGRKGFVAADRDGNIGLYHSTAHRTLLVEPLADTAIHAIAISPRANAMWFEDQNGKMQFWRINNEHPEVSWSSLWGEVWYESYEEPEYTWQSSSSSSDFEPKYSLVPISFGTLKAAFYAMLVAMPLAILGAIYTAYFMAPKMRNIVKPSIEIMEALPTVILGFLAGLWLAPFIESHLPGIFIMLILVPSAIILAAFSWQFAPRRLRHAIPEGWEAALLLPVVVIALWLSYGFSPAIETAFFGGDMRHYLSNELGIDFDQRNALVVGLAMGFAVIPTIFSIAEDAVFGVPRHLSHGSLALGATPWQTMWGVVLLTASPGIFSAVMIGFGRAVGETMIVLMATGNTPIMDMSIFQGLRTLSANIAVEVPESEVASTHYRILFLAALVLFAFTFFFNTLAEVVRQRLRKKYSSL
ncbi:MAG: ABC transporter permease subunit [Gammaproteobacteria bacterium]|nr:ABC transporter permease subunit [Gammaproteobacteria bacterium]MCF6229573.1 ABC transporter permease subunit [Gammaproteobacteria bacterium]